MIRIFFTHQSRPYLETPTNLGGDASPPAGGCSCSNGDPSGSCGSGCAAGGSQGGGKSMNMKPDVGNELNSFISKVLLTELANV